MGNRKKLDMVMASKTSLTPTEIRIPRREKARPEKMKMRTNAQKCVTEILMSGTRMRVMKTVFFKLGAYPELHSNIFGQLTLTLHWKGSWVCFPTLTKRAF
jgi:hypothetical protein